MTKLTTFTSCRVAPDHVMTANHSETLREDGDITDNNGLTQALPKNNIVSSPSCSAKVHHAQSTSLQSAAQKTTDRGEFGDLTRSAAGDTPARMPESQESVYIDMPKDHKLEAEPVDPHQDTHSAQSRAESADIDSAVLLTHIPRGSTWHYGSASPGTLSDWYQVGKPSFLPCQFLEITAWPRPAHLPEGVPNE